MSFDGEGIVTKMNKYGKLKWDKSPVNYWMKWADSWVKEFNISTGIIIQWLFLSEIANTLTQLLIAIQFSPMVHEIKSFQLTLERNFTKTSKQAENENERQV